MANFKLTSENAQIVKTKFLRKYRDLVSADIDFAPGKEDELVQKLMKLVKRDERYIEFTIQKAIAEPKGRL